MPAGGFPIAWNVIRVLIWILVAVWMNPRLLDFVGGADAAHWLIHHGWVRLLGAVPVGVLGLVSLFEPLGGGRRRGIDAFARRTGATPIEPTAFDVRYGVPEGPGLRVPAGRWTIDVWSLAPRGRRRTTVASAAVATHSAFGFTVHGARRGAQFAGGLEERALRHALARAAERSDDPRAQATARRLAWMADPPVTVGHPDLDGSIALRTNQPDIARAVFGVPEVTEPFVEWMAVIDRWDGSYHPDPDVGTAEFRIEWTGSLREAEPLEHAVELMRMVLDRLADTDGAAPGVPRPTRGPVPIHGSSRDDPASVS